MKVGDLVKHKYKDGNAIVTKISRFGGLGAPVHVTAVWMDWRGKRSIEQQYLEVISASR